MTVPGVSLGCNDGKPSVTNQRYNFQKCIKELCLLPTAEAT